MEEGQAGVSVFPGGKGSLPSERGKPVDIQENDNCRNNIPEKRLHPWLYFPSPAAVGLLQKTVPPPAEPEAAEQGKSSESPQSQTI